MSKPVNFNEIDVGDRILDEDLDGKWSVGIVDEVTDIHNIHITYFWGWIYESGYGFSCLDPDCEQYNGDRLFFLTKDEYDVHQRETMHCIVEHKLNASILMNDPFFIT